MFEIFKKNYLLIAAIFSVVLGLVLTTNNALTIYAETINAGVLKIEYVGSGALFNETNIYPGYEITKTVKVTNQGTLPHSFSIAVDNTLGPLADVLVIEPSVLGSVIWTKTVSEIKKSPDSDLIVGAIVPGGTAGVDIKAYLPESVGNEYMGTSTFSFDFLMGNESTDSSESEDENGEIVITEFSSSSVSGISSGVTLKSSEEQNGLEEAEESVLKVNQDEKGEALGVKTEEKPICFWWWVLLTIFAIFLAIFGYFKWNRDQLIIWFWPLFTAIVLYLIHWILHDYYILLNMCPYFIWFQLAGLALYGGGVYMRRSQTPEEEK